MRKGRFTDEQMVVIIREADRSPVAAVAKESLGNRGGWPHPLGPPVIEVLSQLVSEPGAPLDLRSDNGPEFVSRAARMDQ